MNRKTGYIDAAVGAFIRAQHAVRPSDVERAAAAAGLAPEELTQVMSGRRRLDAGELFVFSRVLSVPMSAFYTEILARCTT